MEEPEHVTVARAKGGDEEALTVLYLRYQPIILKYLTRLCGNRQDAEDLTAEVFVRMLRGIGQYEAAGTFSSWIYRIAQNIFLDWNRRRRRITFLSMDESGWFARCDAADFDDEVARALAGLPLLWREAFLLRHLHDYSIEETAQLLGASASAIKTRTFRARRRLAELLSP